MIDKISNFVENVQIQATRDGQRRGQLSPAAANQQHEETAESVSGDESNNQN